MKLWKQWLITVCIVVLLIPIITLIMILYKNSNNIFRSITKNAELNNTNCQFYENSATRNVIEEETLGRTKETTNLLNFRSEIEAQGIKLTTNDEIFITNCTNETYKQASTTSQTKFDAIYNYNNDWEEEEINDAFDKLKTDFNNKILTNNWNKLPGIKSNEINLKPYIDWDDILKTFITSEEITPLWLKTGLLKFYNFMFKIYEKENVLRYITTLENIKETNTETVGTTVDFSTNFGPSAIVYTSQSDFLDASIEYILGYWVSDSPLTTITHEYGHSLDFFLRTPKIRRPYFNDFAALNKNDSLSYQTILNSIQNPDDDITRILNTTNWKQMYLSGFNPNFKTSSGFKVDDPSSNNPYRLKNFLSKKLNITDEIRQILLLWTIVPSEYGRFGKKLSQGLEECFAEAFSYFINTPAEKRGQAWELLSEFFMDYLPKV